MTPEEMKKALAQYAFSSGYVTPEDVESFIDKLASACPQAIADEKGLTDRIAKAYEAMQIERGAATIDVRQTTPATAMPTSSVTAEEAAAIKAKLSNDYSNLVIVSQNTLIKNLVIDNVAPSEVIAAGATGTINEKSWKAILEKWGGKVMDNDPDDAPNAVKSRDNFEALKAAAESGKAVEVHIGKASNRVVAVNVQKPATAGSGATTQIMSMDEFENFVTLETAGYVMATETTPGAKLRYIKETTDRRDPGVIKPARSVLALTRKAQAIEAGNVDISREVTSEIKENAACKSELCFRVDTGKPKAKGPGNISRLIRVTVNAPVKSTARKPQYVQALGNVGASKGAGDLLTLPSPKDMQNISKAQVTSIAALRQRIMASDDLQAQAQYGEQLKAFGVQTAPAQAVTV